jgi:uncharacterized phage protein (TIGR02220 family)
MINIDTRLLDKLDINETWLMLHLAKYFNQNNRCWPSNAKLLEATGWSEKTLWRVKKSLIEKDLLNVEQRYREDGSKSTNTYTFKTDMIGVYVKGTELKEDVIHTDTTLENLPCATPQILPCVPRQESNDIEVLVNEVLTIGKKEDVVFANDVVSFEKPKKKRPSRREEVAPIVEQIIAYLNKKLGNGKFQADTKVTINLISKILAKGYTLQDFYDVLDFKYDDWIGGKLFDNYAPPTLFAESNFEKYYNAAKRAERNVLPPERGQYYDFMALVKEKYNELWKSNVRIFNAAEYADYQNNITMKGMALQASENKRKALAAIMAKLNEDYKLRQSYNSLFDAYIALAKTYLP